MKILILEDESNAAEKLKSMLLNHDSSFEIISHFDRVEDAKKWILSNPTPDLAFFDIQLADDISFSLFEEIDIPFPVIFTTAYDQYLLEAMEVQSIDYLLKPITLERLQKALGKVKKLRSHFIQSASTIETLQQPSRKDRLLVKKGADFVSLLLSTVRYFFTSHKVVFAKDQDGTIFIVDKTLSELMKLLDKHFFFRANRKFIVHIDSIEKFRSDTGKIKLTLDPPTEEEVMISKENAPHFRQWIEG